jgi:hypothetical protein
MISKIKIALYLLVLVTLFLCSCRSPNKSSSPAEQKADFPDGLFFDDFNYSASSDPALKQNGWIVRAGSGGPGPEGAAWDAELISFKTETDSSDNSLLALSAWTEGTPASCHQSELFTPVQFKNGTFAARIIFSDRPDYGPDGDGVVQTFFTIAPWELAENDAYAEFDFEYLPNGGWGTSGPHLWQTSWETVHDKKSDQQEKSHAGIWQHLIIHTDAQETRYFVNEQLRTTHLPPYIADGRMSINFNHWFIAASLNENQKVRRHYTYYVDWLLAAQNTYYSPEQVDSLILEFRLNNRSYFNSLSLN